MLYALVKGLSQEGFLSGERVIKAGTTFLSIALFARAYDSKLFAQFALANATLSVIIVFTTLGLPPLITRNAAFKTNSHFFTHSAVTLSSFLYLTNCTISASLFFFFRTDFFLIYCILSFASFGEISQFFFFENQGKNNIRKIVFLCALANIATLLLRIAIFAFGSNFSVFLATYLLQGALLSSIYISLRYRKPSLAKFNPSLKLMRLITFLSAPLLVNGLVVIVYSRMGLFLLNALSDSQSVANYAVATNFIDIFVMFFSIISTAFYPRMMKAYKISRGDFENLFRKIYTILTLIAFSTAIVVSLSAHYAIPLIFSPNYVDATSTAALCSFFIPFVAIRILSGKWLLANKLHSQLLKRSIFGIVLNFILALFLIPSFGANGAVIASLISYAFVAFVPDLLDPRTRDHGIFKLTFFRMMK